MKEYSKHEGMRYIKISNNKKRVKKDVWPSFFKTNFEMLDIPFSNKPLNMTLPKSILTRTRQQTSFSFKISFVYTL